MSESDSERRWRESPVLESARKFRSRIASDGTLTHIAVLFAAAGAQGTWADESHALCCQVNARLGAMVDRTDEEFPVTDSDEECERALRLAGMNSSLAAGWVFEGVRAGRGGSTD